MSFKDELQAWTEHAQDVANKVVAEAVQLAVETLVGTTPVETGRAASNYFVANDAPSDDVDPDTFDTAGTPSLDRVKAWKATAKWGTTVYITNNIGYALDLDFGTSQKAPAGMSRVLIDRWKNIGIEAERRAKK